ncbi:MAG: hypothetical protein CVT99_14530 [Bacteroidetes bacterium HGW-Bacteroidetes-16]|jgi:uncharacterized membrane protein YagU involved in acid resistance|nr:MAG: hypothetical protein CVT99_14530 [Bacteroidetes bacterium HGW-Bacteroidetes-16]
MIEKMKSKIQQSVLGGILGTAVMTMVMFIAPLMGMPKMNPAAMLSAMMGIPIVVGWVMHFMIGIVFGLGYVFVLEKWVRRINSRLLKGAIFGFAVFIFAQVMMAVMGAVMDGMPSPEGNMLLIMMGSIIGHVVYGIVTVQFIKN